MGAITSEMDTVPLPVWVDMRKVNTNGSYFVGST